MPNDTVNTQTAEPQREAAGEPFDCAAYLARLENTLNQILGAQTDELLPVSEVAKRLHCSESHIRNMIYQRRIPYHSFGSSIRLSLQEVKNATLTKPRGG